MTKFFKLLFSRLVITSLLIIIQLIVLMFAVVKVSNYFVYFYAFFVFLSIAAALWVINKPDNPAYKMAWLIPILLFPIFGGLFYIIFGNKRGSHDLSDKIHEVYEMTNPFMVQDPAVMEELKEKDPDAYKQAYYLEKYSMAPIYKNTESTYLSPGEVMFRHLTEELRKAKKFIFMEYCIVAHGLMFDTILEILEQKVKEGVEVRFMYDDIGCVNNLPYKYYEKLRKKGIKAQAFNPFQPYLSIRMNNRDHRKICVIDGTVGFTGGINLADEYINAYEKYGHWKDSSIMLKGEAVWNLTLMFLQMWNLGCLEDTDYIRFKPAKEELAKYSGTGYVQPFGDIPLDDEIAGENTYINIINNAEEYVYINTPYIVVDNEMISALCLAAKNGIDVRIVTPHIMDKWFVHVLTQSYYPQLIDAGVKVYEYTPGFMHSKTFVSDDKVGVIGTINLDYRSLYLHFECGVWMYEATALDELKEDFLKTLELCQAMTKEDTKKTTWYERACRSLLRAFAPLL